ncbi:MAG: hypothetical protein U1E22_08690 [Coriobacteriia bacterium]|nr:hypothetical protein [Coriobacteriia bacterium]
MRQTSPAQTLQPQRINWTAYIALVLAIVVLAFMVWLLLRNTTRIPEPTGLGRLEPVLIIEGPGTGPKPRFARPLAAAWGLDNRIYVSDTGNSRICVFDSRGSFLSEMTGANESAKAGKKQRVLSQPAGLVVGDAGEVYVADIRSGAVFVLDSSGVTTQTIAPGTGSAKAPWLPTDVALVSGLLYATDSDGVAVFQTDGVPLGRLGSKGTPVELSRPNGIAEGPNESLVVSDTNAQRIASYTATGTLLWELGPAPDGPDPFGLPRGIATSESGTVFVADAFMFGIASISPDGQLQDVYRSRGKSPGQFEYPNDIDVADDLLLVTDKDNNRIQVLRVVDPTPR